MEWWGPSRQVQAVENLPRGDGRMNRGENPEAAFAVTAFQDVNFEGLNLSEAPPGSHGFTALAADTYSV